MKINEKCEHTRTEKYTKSIQKNTQKFDTQHMYTSRI